MLVAEYLKRHNLEVLHQEIDKRPDLIACQACFECPAGPRIRIEILPEDTTTIYNLDLLNITTVEYPDEF